MVYSIINALKGEAMEGFRPIQPLKVYEQVLQQVKELAEEGLLKAGDRLPAERVLAEQLNVSRNSIREAFSVLEALGLVENRLGEGKVIVSTSFGVLTDFISLARDRREENKRDLLEARFSLEPEIVALATARASEYHLTRIGRALGQIQAGAAEGRFDRRADQQFHTAVAEAAGNAVTTKLARLVYELYWEATADPDSAALRAMTEQYQRLYQALIDRDQGAAVKAVRTYLAHAPTLR